LGAGRSQSIFSLDSAQLHNGSMQKLDRVNLREGEDVELDDGTKIRFDGAQEFVNLQVSRDPTVLWVLGFALLMLVSLVGSLRIKRRRFWVRLTPTEEGNTRVEIAGLSRTDSAGWGTEFNRKAEKILGLDDEELDEEFDTDAMDWDDSYDDGLDEAISRARGEQD